MTATAELLLPVKKTSGEKPSFKTKEANDEAGCREFGHRLLTAMEKVDMTQADLARAMNASRSAVNWWTQGKTYPSIDNAKKLARILRTTPEHLVFGVEKVAKERLVDSIPVIDRVNGRKAEITRLTLPKDFVTRAGITDIDHLRAMPIYQNGKTDIAVANTTDKRLSVKTPKLMVIDNGETINVGRVTKKKNDPSTISVEMDGMSFDMPFKERMLVGALATLITAYHA